MSVSVPSETNPSERLFPFNSFAFRLREKHGNDWATIGAALGRSASSVKDRCRLMKDTCNTGATQENGSQLV